MKAKTLAIYALAAIAITGAAYVSRPTAEADFVEYRWTVHEGDTIAAIASKIALPSEDYREIEYKIMRDNGIKNAGALQIGHELIIKVHRVKK